MLPWHLWFISGHASKQLYISDQVDFFIFVGEGRFHPLGVAISADKKVFAFDSDGIYSLNEYKDKILKERFGAIFRAKDSKKFGLVVSSKKGQKRMALANKLKKKIEDSGFKADIILMHAAEYSNL